MKAVDLLINGTIRAAGLILDKHGVSVLNNDADLGRLTDSIKATLKENLAGVLDEWENAVNANLGEAWLRELLNAQCNEMALKAVRAAGFIA